MASPDYSDGCMIALYPPRPLADRLTVPDGLPAEEMHVTVAYLGTTAEVERDTVLAVAQALAARPPISATLSGHARFTGGAQDVIVALVDSADLEDLRRDCLTQLADREVTVSREHGFTPHLTLTYIDPEADSPVERLAAEPVVFGAGVAVYGTDRVTFPFLPAETATRMSSAESATVQLDAPRGIWRPVYARRQALHAAADATVLAAWRKDVTTVELGPAIAAWRRQLGEAADPAGRHRRDAAASAVLAALTAADWPAVRAALTLAAQQAYRAGWAAGHAVASRDEDDEGDYDDQPATGLTVGTPMMPDQVAAATAASVLAAALRAAAQRAGRAITTAPDGPARAAAAAIAGGDDLLLAADTAVSAAYGAGMRAAYLNAVAQALAWVTAGDGRVCAQCIANEDGSPYSPLAAPSLPAHPRCRCCLAPAT
ncbi:2'-5' RNA ligase family protein [Kitasatospora sp. RB6PN24]|uniref:2'-5' RNA ligase family protein n=1 Tax=Kitasatospora humi TaxID=2893891 RepID=UPI001E512E09|nr:2'-5' RNA ligase family protein [Kitasatospora humi]MCC9307692.1 2'-5' RNA ligase family protein [Kitasatospora humi]